MQQVFFSSKIEHAELLNFRFVSVIYKALPSVSKKLRDKYQYKLTRIGKVPGFQNPDTVMFHLILRPVCYNKDHFLPSKSANFYVFRSYL